MGKRLNQQRQDNLQPQRMKHAVDRIQQCGFTIHYQDNNKIMFMYKDNPVSFYPYSGWHSGKGIKDGRGLYVLLQQIKNG